MRDQCAIVPTHMSHSSNPLSLVEDPIGSGIPPTDPPPEPTDPDDPKKQTPVKPPEKDK